LAISGAKCSGPCQAPGRIKIIVDDGMATDDENENETETEI
jgi:hypothetical protein